MRRRGDDGRDVSEARSGSALVRGLLVDPRARFPMFAGLLAELDAVVEGPSRRLTLVLGAAGLGAVLAGAAVLQVRGGPTCAVDDAALAGTRDEPRRAALRARFAGERAFEAMSAATLERPLDAW